MELTAATSAIPEMDPRGSTPPAQGPRVGPAPGGARPAAPRSGFGPAAALVLALVLVAVAPYQLLLPKVPVGGAVVDGISQHPLAGARVVSELSSTTTGANGRFDFERASPAESLLVEANGYLPRRVAVWPPREMHVVLAPRTFSLTVRDAETGSVVAGAAAAAGSAQAEVIEPGRFRIGPAKQDTVATIKADGYLERSFPFRGEAEAEVALRPRLIGTVTDATSGQPIPRAFLSFEGGSLEAERDGTFELKERPNGPVRVLAAGYRRIEVELGRQLPLAIQLEPFAAKGVYLTHYGIADRGLRGNTLDLAEKTEVNALVIDVKGDRGWIAYRSAVPLADQIGANEEPTIPNVEELLASLKQRNIYTIARIVAFKDDKLARNGRRAGLDVAIKDLRTGEPWVDGEGLAWVDPFRPEVWDYNIALAREAAQKGFDEVQFDYIRFPTDPTRGGSISDASYSKFQTEANRTNAITTFLRQARAELRDAGAFLGIDVFGYVAWNEDDTGIGQQLEELAEVVDYLCPMVYPSTFGAGLPGLANYPQVVARPYDVIFQSMKRAQERIEGRGAVLRPWLQYFDDYPWATRRPYNAAEIAAQRKGAADAGSAGWMMWDPANKYARGGFGPKP